MGEHLIVTDPVQQFADAVQRDTGAVIEPIGDGVLHRFDDPDSKRNNRAGWYVLHLDGRPAGKYGSWRRGTEWVWRAETQQPIDPAERARAQAAIEAARQRRAEEREDAQSRAVERAQALYDAAGPVRSDNPYIIKKRIAPDVLRQKGDALVVPLQDVDGTIHNVQMILPTGTKRFLKGGRISGCFALVGGTCIPETGQLYICEGVATAATIAAALNLPVVAAMTAGNLKTVAVAIRQRYPELALVVAADNDHKTAGNPGISKGREAAWAVQGALSWPTVCLKAGCNCTDFNDTSRCERAPQ